MRMVTIYRKPLFAHITWPRSIGESEWERRRDGVPYWDKSNQATNEATAGESFCTAKSQNHNWNFFGEKYFTEQRLSHQRPNTPKARAIDEVLDSESEKESHSTGLRVRDRLSPHTVALGEPCLQPLWVSISNQLILFWFFWPWLHDDCRLRLLRPSKFVS